MLPLSSLLQQPPHLGLRQDHGQAAPLLGCDDFAEPGQINLEHRPIQKQQRRFGLILSRRRHLALNRQIGQELGYRNSAQFLWMAFVIKKKNKSANPIDINVFSSN
jgi:hypothetical protein